MVNKQIIIIHKLCAMLLILACAALAPMSAIAAGPDELVVLNWSEYIDPEVVKEFENKYQVKVKDIYFESDDYRDNYMLETQGEGIDVIVVNGIQLRNYRQQGWMAPLTEKEVPNLKYIDSKWLTMFEGAEGYAAPYFWGTMGIAYRKDMVKSEVTSWNDLYRPHDSLRGKIAMVGASRDLIGTALKALGYSMNSNDFKELRQAKELLLHQKPFVKDYTYISLDETSSMISGEIVMTLVYSGDALMLMDLDENIAYAVPEEGGQLWLDNMVVSNASRNKQLAYDFINFINEPKNAARIAEFVYYATPNTAAEKLLPEDFLTDDVIYPSKEVMDKSEVYVRLQPRATRFRNEIFTTVTQ